MGEKLELNWADVNSRLGHMAETIERDTSIARVYGVPRGGSIVAGMLAQRCRKIVLIDSIEHADFVVDDITDSGATRERCRLEMKLGSMFIELVHKRDEGLLGTWVQFPWERDGAGKDEAVEQNITRLLQYLGEDVDRDGLRDTPGRVVRAFVEMTSGSKQDADALLSRVFEERSDEMIVVKDIRFTSLCEHHLLPFVGTAHVCYIPTDKVVGLSKIPRVVDCFARRLQIQERLTRQIAEAMNRCLRPQGVGVVVEAFHSCMGCRGVVKPEASMITSSMLGVMRSSAEARAEFFSLIRK